METKSSEKIDKYTEIETEVVASNLETSINDNEMIEVIDQTSAGFQQLPGIFVIPQAEPCASNEASKVEYFGEPLEKKIKLDNKDSNECSTFILAVEPQTETAENLSTKIVPSDGSIATLISPAELTPAQQNAMAMYSDPNSQNSINQVWFTTKVDKSYLKNNKGQVWRTGMWSKDEIRILEENIEKYCETQNISDPAVVIFDMNKDERKDFYRIIAKGLNRPLFSVYRRVIRMYDNKNHVGKYTPEELDKLKMLRAKHGKNWQMIGQAMGRSPASIKDKCRLMKDNCNQGKWLPEEERRLADAVYELAQAVPGEIVYSGLSWSLVAERVATRSEKQCRTKWLNYLNWKEVGGTEWTREDDMFLVTKVCSLNAHDESAVDWAVLSEGWPSVRSPQWLRGKWWSLKRQVSPENRKTFRELCAYLYKHHVQNVTHKEAADSSDQSDDLACDSKVTVVQALPSSNIPVCAEVSISGEAMTEDANSSSNSQLQFSRTAIKAYTVMPSQLQICVPASVGHGQTILLTQQVPPGSSETVLTDASNESQQIVMHPISSDLLENVDKYALRMSTGEQVVISTSHESLDALESNDPSSDVRSESLGTLGEGSDIVIAANDEVLSTVVIKSDKLLASEQSSFTSPSHGEITHEQVDTSETSKLILADPMLGASQHSPEIISDHAVLPQEMSQVNEEIGSS